MRRSPSGCSSPSRRSTTTCRRSSASSARELAARQSGRWPGWTTLLPATLTADQPRLVRDDDELRTLTRAQLHHGVADVGTSGRRADEQGGADLVVAQPLPDQRQYFALALGQYRQ